MERDIINILSFYIKTSKLTVMQRLERGKRGNEGYTNTQSATVEEKGSKETHSHQNAINLYQVQTLKKEKQSSYVFTMLCFGIKLS